LAAVAPHIGHLRAAALAARHEQLRDRLLAAALNRHNSTLLRSAPARGPPLAPL
jgi:hypothetical protein